MAQTGMNVRDIARGIVEREGGFVDDPDDPGGATNHGVTIHTMGKLGADLTGDGKVDVEDVRALSQAQAVEIFLKHYFDGPALHLLPEELQPSIFDMYVNAGSNAVRILQRLLREMGHGHLTVDGMVGAQTAVASAQAHSKAPAEFVDAYGIARRNYYFRLADRRPASRKYALSRAGGKGGWIRRAEHFISPRYHLSAASFARRVAAWT